MAAPPNASSVALSHPANINTGANSVSTPILPIASLCQPDARRSRRRHVRVLPVLVGIEHQNVGRLLRGVGPKVLLVDLAVLVDDEGHHAGFAIGHRPGNHAEATDHPSAGEIAVGAA